jgi:hypothetical protein
MRRGVHIAFALLVVLGLLRPFDCLGGALTRKAAACCAKGKCLPSSNADECCKATVPGGNQLSAPKTHFHFTGLHALAAASVPVVIERPSIAAASFDPVHTHTGSPPGSRLNLPLLI